MNIGEAVLALQEGKKLTRTGWNGPGQYLKLMMANIQHQDMTLPYVYINTVTGDRVPWLCSQTDLLAQDWIVVN